MHILPSLPHVFSVPLWSLCQYFHQQVPVYLFRTPPVLMTTGDHCVSHSGRKSLAAINSYCTAATFLLPLHRRILSRHLYSLPFPSFLLFLLLLVLLLGDKYIKLSRHGPRNKSSLQFPVGSSLLNMMTLRKLGRRPKRLNIPLPYQTASVPASLPLSRFLSLPPCKHTLLLLPACFLLLPFFFPFILPLYPVAFIRNHIFSLSNYFAPFS